MRVSESLTPWPKEHGIQIACEARDKRRAASPGDPGFSSVIDTRRVIALELSHQKSGGPDEEG
jgi:hypothetical protein